MCQSFEYLEHHIYLIKRFSKVEAHGGPSDLPFAPTHNPDGIIRTFYVANEKLIQSTLLSTSIHISLKNLVGLTKSTWTAFDSRRMIIISAKNNRVLARSGNVPSCES